MKRYSVYLVLIAVLLGALVASPSLAVFPIPDTQLTFTMQQGWFDDIVTWFICTDTNDIDFAKTTPFPTLAPLLSSSTFPAGGASGMFIVTNPDTSQGPVFDTRPGLASYSGIWLVALVTWQPGFTKVPLTSQPQIVALLVGGEVTVVNTAIRLDCPILALGPLGGPWLAKPYPPFYRIPQGITHNPRTKSITLPAWDVFCQDPISRRVSVELVIIPDVEDAALAAQLGANLAPGLVGFPFADTQRFWWMDPALGPTPWNQLPVVEYCPNGIGVWNTNFNYSPVQRYTVLDRNPPIPPWAVINNPPFIQMLIGAGLLVVIDEATRINAPVIID